jgi:hypothetical protein
MKILFATISLLVLNLSLASSVVSGLLPVEFNTLDSAINPPYVSPTSQYILESINKESASEIIVPLIIGLIGLAGVGRNGSPRVNPWSH